MTASDPVSNKRCADAIAAELAPALRLRLGRDVAAASAGALASTSPGWVVPVAVSGGLRGAATVWFSREISACVPATPPASEVDDAAVAAFLCELVAKATESLASAAPFNRATWTVDAPRAGHPTGPGASAITLDLGDLGAVPVSVAAEIVAPPIAAADERLAAVLDVDLPLVVRFGSAVVPLRTLSALAAGSLVELNRAPDDPVELIVGERVVARGDVVAVDGHYGVRITEVTGAAARPSAGAEA